MPSNRTWVLIGASATVLVIGAAALGWHLIGGALADQLQVEEPGNRDYEEYLGMRSMSLWFGGIVGAALASMVAAAVVWRIVARGRRLPRH